MCMGGSLLYSVGCAAQEAEAGERFRMWPAVRYLMIMRTFWLLTLATGALRPPAALSPLPDVSHARGRAARTAAMPATQGLLCSLQASMQSITPPCCIQAPHARDDCQAGPPTLCGGQACAAWRRT